MRAAAHEAHDALPTARTPTPRTKLDARAAPPQAQPSRAHAHTTEEVIADDKIPSSGWSPSTKDPSGYDINATNEDPHAQKRKQHAESETHPGFASRAAAPNSAIKNAGDTTTK